MITLATVSAFVAMLSANPAGYVASFEGGITLKPDGGAKRVLKPKDLERALRIYPGDTLSLTTKDAMISLVVYGRRVRKSGISAYEVPREDPRIGSLASRAAMAGRGAGGADPAPYEALAILTHQTYGLDPVGNLVPLADGRLPLVWVANAAEKKVRITLTIEGEPPVDTGWIESRSGGAEGYPFGAVASEELGKYVLEKASPDLALPASLQIVGEDGKKNITQWEVPKRSYLEDAVSHLRDFELNAFDGFDEAVAFCEGTVGEKTSLPTYPMMRTYLVYQRWKEQPNQWVRLSMLHLLTLEYRFDGLEERLKKVLQEKDGEGGTRP